MNKPSVIICRLLLLFPFPMREEFIQGIHHQTDQEEDHQRSTHPNHGETQPEF